MTKTEFQHTAGNAGMIGLMAFGGALVGFVLQLIVAYHFGADAATDAYFMAQSTSEMLSKLLLGGSITAVFIPLFVERLTRGAKESAWDLALNLFHLVTAVYVVFIILLGVFAQPFVRFIAPGFPPETSALTVSLLRVILPSFFFLFLVQFATSMLHSLKLFVLPALLRIIAPLISIVVIIASVKAIGIYSLAWGAVIGSMVQFAVLAAGLKKQGLAYRWIMRPKDPSIAHLVQLAYPFFFSVAVTQLAGIVYRILVSDLQTGSLAALKFAEKIDQLLVIMFLNSVTLVIYPLMSAKAARLDFAGMRDTIAAAVRLIFFTTIPLVVGVAILRVPLISFVYQSGSFTPEDAVLTNIALLFLIIGLTTNGISSVFGYAVLALKETHAAVAVTVASQFIATYLFVLLVPPLAHGGLALASSLVPLASTLLYFLYLARYIPRLTTIFYHPTYLKTIILAVLLGLAVKAAIPLASALPLAGKSLTAAQVFLPTIAGSAVFFTLAHLWRVQEMTEMAALARAKITKWRGK